MVLKKEKAQVEVPKAANKYLKLGQSGARTLQSRGITGFDSPETACLEWIALQVVLTGIIQETALITNPKHTHLKVRVLTWRLLNQLVVTYMDISYRGRFGPPRLWHAFTKTYGPSRLYFGCTYSAGGRSSGKNSWVMRSVAKLIHQEVNPGFLERSYGMVPVSMKRGPFK